MQFAQVQFGHALFRVRVAGEDGEGAVELLGEHGAGEFVRQGERRKRDFVVARRRGALGKSFGVAAKEHHFAETAVAWFSQPFCELG